MLNQHHKARHQTLSCLNGEHPVVIVSIQQRPKMHCDIWQVAVCQHLLVTGYFLCYWIILLVKNEGYEVEARCFADIARFVNEDGKLFSHCGLLEIKNAGGHPPALGGRPFREDQLLYTMTQGVLLSYNFTRTYVLKHLVKAGEML